MTIRALGGTVWNVVLSRFFSALMVCSLGLCAADNSVTLPYQTQRGHIMLSGQGSNAVPLNFMVDTGYGINMIHPDWVEKLGLRKVGKITIVGIAGEEQTDTYAGLNLNFGRFNYAPRRVAALSAESGRSRRRDGVLGSGFFRRFVVELDPGKSTATLYEPSSFDYAGSGAVIPLSFRRDTPIIEARLGLSASNLVTGRFEIDTGCDGGLCLGHDFVVSNALLDSAKGGQPSARRGVGGSARTVEGKLPFVELGGKRVANAQAQFFTSGSPVDAGMAGHVGWDLLRHFRVVLDYSRRRLILEDL